MTAEQSEARPLLYYAFTMCCPFCPDRPFTCRLVAEVEPPPDTIVRPRCPYDGMPIPIRFSNFKPCEPFPPEPYHLTYPPRPEPPQPPEPAKPRWWQFWKR